jgi:hypothetical protein
MELAVLSVLYRLRGLCTICQWAFLDHTFSSLVFQLVSPVISGAQRGAKANCPKQILSGTSITACQASGHNVDLNHLLILIRIQHILRKHEMVGTVMLTVARKPDYCSCVRGRSKSNLETRVLV